MKSLVIDSVNVDRNLTDVYQIGKKDPVMQVEGRKDINWEGHIDVHKDIIEAQDLVTSNVDNPPELEYIEWMNGCLIKCQITSFNMSASPGQPYVCSVEGIAEDYDEEREIQFSDCKKKVSYKWYFAIKKNYGRLDKMTYDKFKQYAMIEDL